MNLTDERAALVACAAVMRATGDPYHNGVCAVVCLARMRPCQCDYRERLAAYRVALARRETREAAAGERRRCARIITEVAIISADMPTALRLYGLAARIWGRA